MKRLRIHPAFVVIVFCLVVWQIAGGHNELVDDIVGTPSVIIQELGVVLTSANTWQNLGVTGFELVLGLLLAVIIGLVLSLGLGTDQYVHETLEPLLLIGNTVPKIILLPAFLMLMGTGYSSKIAFGALHGMLPIAIIVSNGVRKSLASEQTRAAMTMDATKRQLVLNVLLPSVLPYLVTALRLAVSLTLLGVILGEMYVARAGLGYMLMRWYGELQIPKMLSVVVIIGALASILDFVLRRLEAHVWRNHGFRQPQHA